MNERMLLDRMSQMIRLGFVNARQPEKMRVKVTLPDTTGSQLVTDWLPVLCPRACGDMQYDLPDIGDQVLCLFLAYGLEQGFVIGSMYGRQTPPVASGDKWHRTFSDGAKLEYDRASHTLTADIPGTASIKASQSITLEAPIIYLRGTLQNTARDGSPGKSVFSGGMEVMNGGINAMDGDIVASGVSLASHTTEGVQPGSGTSSHPTGGSVESPGTAAMAVPAAGTAAFVSYVARHLNDLSEKVEKEGNSIDRLIMCLPDIAENMASFSEDEAVKKAWFLLKEFFEIWLAGIGNNKPEENENIYFIDKDWIFNHHRVKENVQKFFHDFITNKFIDELDKLLKKYDKFTDKLEFFDFRNSEDIKWDDKKNWEKWLHNYCGFIGMSALGDNLELDDLSIALGSFTLKALPGGYVQPLGQSRYKVCITDMALFAHDTFSFNDRQNLGCWNCETLKFNGLDCSESYPLTNFDFCYFRNRLGHGNDFTILSQPVLLAGFEGKCYETRI